MKTKKRSRISKGKPQLKYLAHDVDRHGNKRWYLRVAGRPKCRFKQAPFSDNGRLRTEFLLEYDEALAAILSSQTTAEANKQDNSSLGYLLKRYFASQKFRSQAPATQRDKRSVLGRYAAEHGHRPYKGFTRKHLEMSVFKRADTPGAADKLIKYLKAVYNWAIEQELADKNPTIGISKINKTDGHHAWTEEEIERYRMTHPLGTMARAALELTLNSGARRDDLVKLGPRNLAACALAFTPGKVTRADTKQQVVVPLLDSTRIALEATEKRGLTFLLNEYGRPFTGNGFGNRMRKWADDAGLHDCSTHGLRKSAAIRMAYAGATAPELMAVFGWADVKTALYYVEQAEKARLTSSAFAKLMAAEGL